jgi:hypothetical protein
VRTEISLEKAKGKITMRTSYRSWVYNIKVYLKLERCENLEFSYLGKEKIQ